MRISIKFHLPSILFLLTTLLSVSFAYAQEEVDKEKMAEYREEVKQMASFLQFSLNVLGDPTVSAKEKDIIINESYLKVFVDDKVQVEDDLVENRDVVTNKDIQAYLKDVDFFFKQVKFEFNIIDIADDINHEGKLFFTVKMMRNLSGITVEDDSVNSDQERYIEVNVDEENKDLRIASIYTTKLSRDEELTFWWGGLSYEWKTLLGVDIEVKEGLLLSEIQEFSDSTYWTNDMQFTDSISIIDFVKIAANREEIILSGSKILTDLKPLDQLKKLKVLDISKSDITDLFPIRNLTTIEKLDCSNTMVDNLKPLKYSKSLKQLYINNTPVTSITVIENFENLELLYMEHTVIDSLPSVNRLTNLKKLNVSSTNLGRLDSVKYLTSLEFLDISNTSVMDLQPISSLTGLKSLNVSKTKISTLEPLTSLSALEEINIEGSLVDDLSPLKDLEQLQTVYADDSKVDLADFVVFSSTHSDVDIVFMTVELFDFWDGVDGPWLDALGSKLNFEDSISKADIHHILKIKELDLRGNHDISDLLPLKYMPLLEILDFSSTNVSEIDPIENLSNLRILKGKQSKVTDISAVQKLSKLEVLDFEETGVADISALAGLNDLDSILLSTTKVHELSTLDNVESFKIAYFENTPVSDDDVYSLTFDEEQSVVVYKSEKLRVWWGNMDDNWQDIFRKLNGLSDRPSAEELHQLVGKRSLEVQGTSIKTLDPIPEFIRLESLSFSDTRVNSLYPLINMRVLKELNCPSNPIEDIAALTPLNSIEVLDLDNTQIKDIKGIRTLTKLRELKFAGTMVKDISPIEGMKNLESLDFSKTRVRQVNALSSLDNLKVLKCFNNKISEKKIEEFKTRNPDCEVVFY